MKKHNFTFMCFLYFLCWFLYSLYHSKKFEMLATIFLMGCWFLYNAIMDLREELKNKK